MGYVDGGVLGFHMPGHGQGRTVPARFAELIREHGLACDITQVLGMDDILRPDGPCLEAQRLAADLYGADHSYFLINGSSGGIHAMLLAAVRPGETVLLPRNVHRSTIAGLQLCGARAIFFETPHDGELDTGVAATVEAVAPLLQQHPAARALFLTSPTYHGAAADVRRLVELAHAANVAVLVDEAWGAHLAFHPQLPTSALEAGADVVVHSTHKLLAGMSQGAMLHLRGERVDRERLEDALRILQSTSPSTVIVASLDVARQQMAAEGTERWSKVLSLAERARERINATAGLRCFGAELAGRPGIWEYDLSRLVIRTPCTGYAAERWLRQHHGIQVEMADRQGVIALLSAGHEEADLERLLQGLHSLPSDQEPRRSGPRWRIPETALSLRDAFNARHETVSVDEAAGRICAELISPYPPGVPALLPGEIIAADIVSQLVAELRAGVQIQGAADPQLRTLRVVCRA